eukprot:1288413-Rhodomonas_salina.1
MQTGTFTWGRSYEGYSIAGLMTPPVSVQCPAVLDMGRKVLVGMVVVEPTNQHYTSSFARNCLETA